MAAFGWNRIRAKTGTAQRSIASRSRSALIAGFLFFLSATLWFGPWADRSPAFYDPPFAMPFAKWNRLKDGPPASTAAILGGSRIVNGLQAGRIGDRLEGKWQAFNFGFPGAGARYQYVLMQRLASTGRLPDRIYLEIFPAIMCQGVTLAFEQVALQRNRFSKAERRALADCGWWEAEGPKRFLGNPWSDFRSPLLLRSCPVLEEHDAENREIERYDKWGWFPIPPEALDPGVREKSWNGTRGAYRPLLARFECDPTSFEALRRTVKLGRERGCEVKILLMPESSEFRSWYGPETNGKFFAALRSLDVPVIDARTWIPDPFFYDFHHLLPEGAVRFTERFCEEEFRD